MPNKISNGKLGLGALGLACLAGATLPSCSETHSDELDPAKLTLFESHTRLNDEQRELVIEVDRVLKEDHPFSDWHATISALELQFEGNRIKIEHPIKPPGPDFLYIGLTVSNDRSFQKNLQLESANAMPLINSALESYGKSVLPALNMESSGWEISTLGLLSGMTIKIPMNRPHYYLTVTRETSTHSYNSEITTSARIHPSFDYFEVPQHIPLRQESVNLVWDHIAPHLSVERLLAAGVKGDIESLLNHAPALDRAQAERVIEEANWSTIQEDDSGLLRKIGTADGQTLKLERQTIKLVGASKTHNYSAELSKDGILQGRAAGDYAKELFDLVE